MKAYLFTLLALLLLPLNRLQAGKLSDFEKAATGSSSTPKPSVATPRYPDDDDEVRDSRTHRFVGALFEPMAYGLLYGGLESWSAVRPGDYAWEEEQTEGFPRTTGSALIPFARLDSGYQWVDEGISALDFRGELGYGPLALQGRYTRFKEEGESTDLDLGSAHILYRMSFMQKLGIDFGLGRLYLEGEERHSAASFTMPVHFHPTPNLGIEYRPVWATMEGNEISDHDLSLHVGLPHVSLRGGYRWVKSGGETLDGPQVGLALRW